MIKTLLSAGLIATALLSLPASAGADESGMRQAVEKMDIMRFRDVLDALENLHRSYGKNVIYMAQGANVPLIRKELFEKYKKNNIYLFAKSITAESDHEIVVKRIASQNNDGYDTYVIQAIDPESTEYDRLIADTDMRYDIDRLILDLETIKKRGAAVDEGEMFDYMHFRNDMNDFIADLKEYRRAAKRF